MRRYTLSISASHVSSATSDFGLRSSKSLLKDKVDCQYQKAESDQMVHFDRFVFEENHREDHEHHESDDFLKDFEFDQREGSTVFFKADSIGRHLKEVFKEGDAPTDHHDTDQAQVFKPFQVFELQVTIPGKGHKGVG